MNARASRFDPARRRWLGAGAAALVLAAPVPRAVRA